MQPVRVMYVVKQFPQISESYIKTEIQAVSEKCDVKIITTKPASLAAKNHPPFEHIEDLAMIREAIEDFHPHVLHTHWLHAARAVGQLSKQTKIPFTARTHSLASSRSQQNPPFGCGPTRSTPSGTIAELLPAGAVFLAALRCRRMFAKRSAISAAISVWVFSRSRSIALAWKRRASATTRLPIAIRW